MNKKTAFHKSSKTRVLLHRAVLLFCVWLAPAMNARADVQPSSLFTNDMILQRDRKTPIWGAADAGERVVVTFEKQKKSTTADENGNWRVELDPLAANAGATLTIEGKNKIELKNVAVGEVWICSGQSNMEWTLQNAKNGKAEVAAADYPQIRLFTVAKKTQRCAVARFERPVESLQSAKRQWFFGGRLFLRA